MGTHAARHVGHTALAHGRCRPPAPAIDVRHIVLQLQSERAEVVYMCVVPGKWRS